MNQIDFANLLRVNDLNFCVFCWYFKKNGWLHGHRLIVEMDSDPLYTTRLL